MLAVTPLWVTDEVRYVISVVDRPCACRYIYRLVGRLMVADVSAPDRVCNRRLMSVTDV